MNISETDLVDLCNDVCELVDNRLELILPSHIYIFQKAGLTIRGNNMQVGLGACNSKVMKLYNSLKSKTAIFDFVPYVMNSKESELAKVIDAWLTENGNEV